MLDTLLNTIQTTLGPLGPVIIIGALGLVLIPVGAKVIAPAWGAIFGEKA